jgi:hypothetical protein
MVSKIGSNIAIYKVWRYYEWFVVHNISTKKLYQTRVKCTV